MYRKSTSENAIGKPSEQTEDVKFEGRGLRHHICLLAGRPGGWPPGKGAKVKLMDRQKRDRGGAEEELKE